MSPLAWLRRRPVVLLLRLAVLVRARRAAMSRLRCVEGLVLLLEREWVVPVASTASGTTWLRSELPTYVPLPYYYAYTFIC